VVELLRHGADPNLPLSGAVRNALCAAVSTAYERQRTTAQRIALLRKRLCVVVSVNFRKPVIFVRCIEFPFSLMGKLIPAPRLPEQ